MDNTCKVLSIYSSPACRTPPWSQRESFFDYELAVSSILMDVGDPSFMFVHENGKFSTGSNYCECEKYAGALNSASVACGCACNVGGNEKRSVWFRA